MDCKSLNIAYIGGGSRGRAWEFMSDLALEPQLCGEIRLYDIDKQAAQNNAVIGNRISERTEAVGKWSYTAVDSLEDALRNVDFVIVSIQTGTYATMRIDVHMPERHGIFQSVGDTTGPGGIIRSLRTIPVFAHIAEAIREYAPDAWVINYSNPMAQCIRALYHYFPQIKAFGCCNEVFGTQELLAQVLWTKEIVKDVRGSDIHINVLGLNHFTWVSKASLQGLNIKGIFKEFVREHMEDGFETDVSRLPDIIYSSKNRVKFDLFMKYGWMAAAGDRYLAEFMPGTEYLASLETIRKWGFYLAPVDWRESNLKKRIAKSERLLRGEEKMRLEPSGGEGIMLIKSLCGMRRTVSNVNLPNTSFQVENLPGETIVETNALFSYNDVRPVMAGAIEGGIKDLIDPHVKNQTTVFEAAIKCERGLVYEAFERDPLIAGRLTQKEIVSLVDDMIKSTSEFLPEEWVG